MLTLKLKPMILRYLILSILLLAMQAPLKGTRADMGTTVAVSAVLGCGAYLIVNGKSIVVKAQRKAMKKRFLQHPVVTSFLELADREDTEIATHINLSNLDEMFTEKDIRLGYHFGKQSGRAYAQALLSLETSSPTSFLGAFRTGSFYKRLQLNTRVWPMFVELDYKLAPNLPPGTGIYVLPNERGEVERVFIGLKGDVTYYRNAPLDRNYITKDELQKVIESFSKDSEFTFKVQGISHSSQTMLGTAASNDYLIELDIINNRFDTSVAQTLLSLLKSIDKVVRTENSNESSN